MDGLFIQLKFNRQCTSPKKKAALTPVNKGHLTITFAKSKNYNVTQGLILNLTVCHSDDKPK